MKSKIMNTTIMKNPVLNQLKLIQDMKMIVVIINIILKPSIQIGFVAEFLLRI